MKKNKNKGKVVMNVKIPVSLFRDENDIWIAFNKKFNISAYSKSKKEALKMFYDSVMDILKWTKQHD